MSVPRKLLDLVRDKVPRGITHDGKTAIWIEFVDSWRLRIDTDGKSQDHPAGSRITHIDQSGTAFSITYADGQIDAMTLADPASSIMLRDATGAIKYTD